MASRARIIPEPPPTFPPLPGWARPRAAPEGVGDAGFLAGAALAAIHPMARDEHILGSLWRQRLALANAAVLACNAGRTEDEAALRDAWYLTPVGGDPGPAGRILRTWRRLGERAAMRPDDWMLALAASLELRLDDRLEDVIAVATRLAEGEGPAVAAAVEIAAASMRFRPDSEPLALWLADAVLAHRLKWPAPVPLLAAQVRRGELRAAAKHVSGDSPWLTACCLAYARAAAGAADLYVDLARRADRLLAAAPKLRGKDADEMVAILLMEDAQPARTGKTASDRSSRRLFERLVALGGVRELTGRPAFRLYGL
ncbi:DUF1403 family protein [Rhizobium ruizarguesonis]